MQTGVEFKVYMSLLWPFLTLGKCAEVDVEI